MKFECLMNQKDSIEINAFHDECNAFFIENKILKGFSYEFSI